MVNQTASTPMKSWAKHVVGGGKKDVTRVTRIKEVLSKEHTGLYAEILQSGGGGGGGWANLGYFRKGGAQLQAVRESTGNDW